MEAIGPVLVVLSIPLMRWIPQNRFFGRRIPATCRNESVWYDANALRGHHLVLLGLLVVALELLLPPSMAVLVVTGWFGVVGIVIADWRTSNRWRREREAVNH